jgi:palmitoyl transferase
MRSALRAGALLLTLIAPLAVAQDSEDSQASEGSKESPSFWSRSVDAVNSTTPFPVGGKEAQDKGWFSGAWDGTKNIWRDGNWDLLVSGYTWHLPYAYSPEKRQQENSLTWGFGIGKTLVDERDNQRILYTLIISDSHYKPQYSAGYGWMARWKAYENIRVGAGYTAFIMARSDIHDYVPFPGVAPLASIGTNRFSLFGTFIPGHASILYFFGILTFDAK